MGKKDWTGNKNSVYKTLGSSAHSEGEREENDYYATPPKAVHMLLALESISDSVWEPACGEGAISEVLKQSGRSVLSTDLIDRKYQDEVLDFLSCERKFDGDIVTNPPYKFALQFVEKALSLVRDGDKVVMFLRLQFLEGKKRGEFFKKAPPCTVYVSSNRLQCSKNGEFDGGDGDGGASCFCWFVWVKGHTGQTVVKWFNQ